LADEASLAHHYEIWIPGFRKPSVVFEANRVTYGRTALYYYDITAIAFQGGHRRRSHLPATRDYRFQVWTASDMIDVRFATAFQIGEPLRQDAMARLEWFSRRLIYPGIIEKLVIQIFQLGDTVRVGDLHIDAEGYFKRGFFGLKTKANWAGCVDAPTVSGGQVTVWRAKKDRTVKLAALSALEPNAVVLPELIPACAGIARKFSME
jgi:hypothetical protein